MTIDRDTAEAMAVLLETARDAAPLRQTRGEMHARAREWRRALDTLEEVGEGWTIELAGAVVPHMRYAAQSFDGRMEGQTIDRVLHRDGGVTVSYKDQISDRPVYVNYISAQSPVVVKAR